jgi:hypothetical protein
MTRLLVSTVRRHIPGSEPSGYLYAVDWESRQILRRCSIVEPAYREVDDNPRGGMRGSKGISVRPDQIAVSNFSMIFRYDPHWNLLGVITHPSCAGIHDIAFSGDTLWVASARTDMLVQFDLQGLLIQYHYIRQRTPRSAAAVLDALKWSPPLLFTPNDIQMGKTDFRDPRSHEKETYDRAHVNSVCLLPGDDLLVSAGYIFGGETARLLRLKIQLVRLGIYPVIQKASRQARRLLGKPQKKNMDTQVVAQAARAKSALIRIDKDGSHSLRLLLDEISAPSHSLLLLADGTAVYLNTTAGSVVRFDPSISSGILSNTQVTDGFLRGAMQLPDQTLLLGSRGELIHFDPGACQVLDRMTLTGDEREAVYDIKELPEHYSLPPAAFDAHFAKTTGFSGAAAFLKSSRP